ncbi:MAG TPA: polysaccharide deacetylase family protein [Xanthobacteraceae bacterium]|jgi:peptidoglycan/xylan/chitin deacetylase (PgdA/CDA1 family)|nr:polysaccharide deacetylase family protein [Xanthobacteraceae bacterium]
MFDLTLSFDNGPDPEVTPHVLDVLARRNLRATFFVIGEKIAQPARWALAERAQAEGHWIGNHSYTHSTPFGLRNEPGIASIEIGRTQDAIGKLAYPRKYFRPFGGGGHLDRRLLSSETVAYLERERYTCVLWNSIPRDWEDPEGWVPRALAQCRALPQSETNWTLMVLHDLPTGAMRHLDRFLGEVADAGGHIRQEFPPDCVPIVDGIAVAPLDRYVTAVTGDRNKQKIAR